MTSTIHDSYIDDLLYIQAINHLQKGEWEDGLARLNDLIDLYPLAHDLRAFRQEMELRSSIDKTEKVEKRTSIRKGSVNLLTRLAGFLILIVVVAWGISAYSGWINDRIADAQGLVTTQYENLQIVSEFNQGLDYLNSERPTAALEIFNAIKSKDADYPQIDERISEALALQLIIDRYDDAKREYDQGNYQGALPLLAALSEDKPYFRDVDQLISNIRHGFQLEEFLASADTAFDTEQWENAIIAYDRIREVDLNFQKTHIEERLYVSLLNAANMIITADSESLDALNKAEAYFKRALSITPQNPAILQEISEARESLSTRMVGTLIQMADEVIAQNPDDFEHIDLGEIYYQKALSIDPDNEQVGGKLSVIRNYKSGFEYFNKKDFDNSIANLSAVVVAEPTFAAGTAAQMLYDAYIARGDIATGEGEIEAALDDYLKATLIAQDHPESIMRLFESQVRVANSQGALRNYEDAVILYQDALIISDYLDLASNNVAISDELEAAEQYAFNRDYRSSYLQYKETIKKSFKILQKNAYQVVKLDYLSSIARKYYSSAAQIIEANNLTGKQELDAGIELLIPRFPSE